MVMEYAIFPMETINISQRANGTTSHQHLQAWDIAGIDTGIEEWYAPCTVKVLAINPDIGMYNTVFFGSCDSSGNPAAVHTENGTDRILTFVCTHMNDSGFSKFGLKVGKIFNSGTPCYQEGTKGIDGGNHVHMEVAEGWQYNKSYNSYGVYETNGAANIADIFFQLSGFNTIGGAYGANGYTFQTVTNRDDYVVPPAGDKSNICFMHLTGSAARLRADVVNGNILTTIPNGTTFEIVGLYSWNASDGYKWGWGKYNGVEGYFQYDPAVMNPVGYGLKSFKMRLTGSAARLRSTIQGTILTTVPNGSTIQIDEFIDGKQSDGYQWCYGHYNGTYGYFQYDPAVMFPTND